MWSATPRSWPRPLGATAYGHECSRVDMLSDTERTLRLIVERLEQANPVTRSLLQANFLQLDWIQQPRGPSTAWSGTQAPVPGGVPAWLSDGPGDPGTRYLEPIAGPSPRNLSRGSWCSGRSSRGRGR